MGSCSSSSSSTAVAASAGSIPQPTNRGTNGIIDGKDKKNEQPEELSRLEEMIDEARWSAKACESLSKLYAEGSREFGVKKHLALAKFYASLNDKVSNDTNNIGYGDIDQNDKKFDAIIELLNSEKKKVQLQTHRKVGKVDQEVVKRAVDYLSRLAAGTMHTKSFEHLIDLYAANGDYYVEHANKNSGKVLVKIDFLQSLYWARLAIDFNIPGGYAELFLGRYYGGGNTILPLKKAAADALQFFTTSAAKGNAQAKEEIRHLFYCRRNDSDRYNNSYPVGATTEVIVTMDENWKGEDGKEGYTGYTLIKMDDKCNRLSIPVSKDFAHLRHSVHLPPFADRQKFDYFHTKPASFSRDELFGEMISLLWITKDADLAGSIVDCLCSRFSLPDRLSASTTFDGTTAETSGSLYLIENSLRRNKLVQQHIVRHFLWAGISHVDLLKSLIIGPVVAASIGARTTGTFLRSEPTGNSQCDDSQCVDFILREHRQLQQLTDIFDHSNTRRTELRKVPLPRSQSTDISAINDFGDVRSLPAELLNLIGDYFPWLHYRRIERVGVQ